MKIQLLLGRDCGKFWEICGVTYVGAGSFGQDYVELRASKVAIEAVKIALANGKRIAVSKSHKFEEILPSDLVIEKLDELTTKKRIALDDVNALMQQNTLGLCILDAMSYLKSYMDLLANGIFISNSNREDKYFEVIEAAQENPEPDPLPADATVEEEQAWLDKKRAYQSAQDNFKTLEAYLNSLDKLQKIDFVNGILREAKESIESAESEEDINKAVAKYKETVYSHFYTPFGSTSLVPKDQDQDSEETSQAQKLA